MLLFIILVKDIQHCQQVPKTHYSSWSISPGPDSICPELILHARATLKSWLRDFLRRLKIPKIWRRALVVTIPKPGKPVGNPKRYRPISLLCVPYKILERLIYARVEPLIDPLLPKEQVEFRRGKLTVDRIVLLNQNIEDSFEAKKKAGAVFINLTAAYDSLAPWSYLQASETTSG